MENLQDFLIDKRNDLGLSLRNAAQLIGISHSYLSTLEKGIDPRNNTVVKPTPETLQLISKAYKISYEKLMSMAGYIAASEAPIRELSEKNERDIEKAIEKLRRDLTAGSFMLSGEAISEEALESLIETLSFGIRQAKIINKKYTPKKYIK